MYEKKFKILMFPIFSKKKKLKNSSKLQSYHIFFVEFHTTEIDASLVATEIITLFFIKSNEKIIKNNYLLFIFNINLSINTS